MRSALLKYLILIIIYLLLSQVSKHVLGLDKLVYSSLSEKLTENQITEFLEYSEKWKWLEFIYLPIIILFKVAIIGTVLQIGFFLNNLNFKFKEVFNILINAEFIFLFVIIFKVIWFYFFFTNYNLNDIQHFYPFSALNIIGYNGVEAWLLYPLQTINLFEVAYIIYLSYQIGNLTKTNADNGLKILVYSYLPALLLWVTVVMFFTLNYS